MWVPWRSCRFGNVARISNPFPLHKSNRYQLNNFFASVFTGKGSNHTAQVMEGKNRGSAHEELPTVGEDQVRDHLRNLKVRYCYCFTNTLTIGVEGTVALTSLGAGTALMAATGKEELGEQGPKRSNLPCTPASPRLIFTDSPSTLREGGQNPQCSHLCRDPDIKEHPALSHNTSLRHTTQTVPQSVHVSQTGSLNCTGDLDLAEKEEEEEDVQCNAALYGAACGLLFTTQRYHIKHAKLETSRGTVTAGKNLTKTDSDRPHGKKKMQTPFQRDKQSQERHQEGKVMYSWLIHEEEEATAGRGHVIMAQKCPMGYRNGLLCLPLHNLQDAKKP
ncbi:hypothetical protein llap_12938 [Limosa lapponica baueri]|uniref:Uncharacterized protein n=1 Tax=Limosa lapponica baueri TaxID=1758121 RepID=A0A2I0TSJ7_LIMLA|nr:hypothetical protein llap_12938 [Limosa lapponica baueri]